MQENTTEIEIVGSTELSIASHRKTVRTPDDSDIEATFPSEGEVAAKEIGEQVREMVHRNWDEFRKSLQDADTNKGKIAFSVSVTVLADGGADIVTKLGFSTKFEDEARGRIENPQQENLQF